MLNVKYDYSCVHVDLPKGISNEIIEWGRKYVTDEDIYVSQKDPTFGREDEIHTTILYGIHGDSPEEVKNVLQGFGPIKASLGKINIFTNPYHFDVVMIEVESSDLCNLNKALSDNIKHTNKYGDYKPHVTIAYVKKNKGWRYLGKNKFQGKQFICDECVFSSKDGIKYRFFI
jgi:2'-5' RNA ligase